MNTTDGREIDREALDVIRELAMTRITDGEAVSAVMTSYGLCRTRRACARTRRSAAPLGRTWAPRGKTPVVATSGQRQSVNAISAVSPLGAFWYKVYTGRLNAGTFQEFLKDFLKRRRRCVFLVVDGHPGRGHTP